jgi:hypothetical protein
MFQNVPCEKMNNQPQNPGALVSAGFKVSAAGGSNSPVHKNSNNSSRINKTTSHQNINEAGSKYYALHKLDTISDQPVAGSSRHEAKSQMNVVRKCFR